MFGLSIIKTQDLKDLKWSLQKTRELLDEKEEKIAHLYEEIACLKDKIAEQEAPVKSVNLITDVAEAPLVVEKKKRVVKKSTSSTQKRVVRKSDEGV